MDIDGIDVVNCECFNSTKDFIGNLILIPKIWFLFSCLALRKTMYLYKLGGETRSNSNKEASFRLQLLIVIIVKRL